MGFHSLLPQAPLDPLVQMLWDWQGPPQPRRLERILPVANAAIIINLAEDETRTYDEQHRCQRYTATTLDGPRSASNIIDTDEQIAVMGVVFRPGGAALFFRERMDTLANGSANLEDLPGTRSAQLREQLLMAGGAHARLDILRRWLLKRTVDDPPSNNAVMYAVNALRLDPRVAAIRACAQELAVSPRLLSERFRQMVGLTPKRYLRLQRFHRVVADSASHDRTDWAGIAADCGYHDQAHLAHEFREFSGLTPTDFSRRRLPWNGHIALD